MQKSKRNINVDVIKGIAIILMVYGHTTGPFNNFIYLFHMAVFFIASGYCWNIKHSESAKSVLSYIWKKIKGLYIPCVLANSFFVLANNLFLLLHIYTDNQSFTDNVFGLNLAVHYAGSLKGYLIGILSSVIFGTSNEFGSATWFLRCLFIITVAHAVFSCLIKNLSKKTQTILQVAVLIFCAIFAFLINKYGEFIPFVTQSFAAYLLYYGGILIRKFEMPKFKKPISLLISVTSFLLLVFFNSFESVGLNTGKTGNLLAFLCVSLLGWTMLWYLAEIFAQPVNKVLQYIGRHTLSIVLWHLLCFRAVSFIFVAVSNKPIELVSSFPTISNVSGFWVLAYCIAGVGIPLLIGFVYSLLKNKIVNLKNKNTA